MAPKPHWKCEQEKECGLGGIMTALQERILKEYKCMVDEAMCRWWGGLRSHYLFKGEA